MESLMTDVVTIYIFYIYNSGESSGQYLVNSGSYLEQEQM